MGREEKQEEEEERGGSDAVSTFQCYRCCSQLKLQQILAPSEFSCSLSEFTA